MSGLNRWENAIFKLATDRPIGSVTMTGSSARIGGPCPEQSSESVHPELLRFTPGKPLLDSGQMV